MAIIDANAGTWTAAQVLADVRQKARIPAGTLDYSDTVLLEEATRAIWSFAGWAMTKAQDGRLLGMLQRSSASAFNTQYAPGREVDLPVDAVGDTFDSVVWVDNTGVEARLDLIEEASQPLYDAPSATGTPWGYSVVDGRLRLYPKPSSPGNVRIAYQRRLPRLIAAASAGIVTTSSTTSADFRVYDGGTLAGAVGDRIDVISAQYPYRYAVPNVLVTSVVPATAYVSTDYNSATCPYPATNELTGFIVVDAGSSPFVHLPLEFKQCLTQKIAAQVLGEIGDMQGSASLEQKAEVELARVVQLLTPRAKTSRVKVVNPHSHLRSRSIRGMR